MVLGKLPNLSGIGFLICNERVIAVSTSRDAMVIKQANTSNAKSSTCYTVSAIYLSGKRVFSSEYILMYYRKIPTTQPYINNIK